MFYKTKSGWNVAVFCQHKLILWKPTELQQPNERSKEKKETYKVSDFVRIKTDKVDKTTSLNPNVLLGKVKEIEGNYARIASWFDIISTY